MEVRQLFRAKSPLVDRREVRDSNTLILGLGWRSTAIAEISQIPLFAKSDGISHLPWAKSRLVEISYPGPSLDETRN